MKSEKELKELAGLLFPDVGETVEGLLKKFPPRDLPQGAEVLRLAPSPTGYLHLGNFYSAFIQYLAVKRTGGIFYLRLEDTDQKREIQEAGEIAYKTLTEYGITPDEGYRGNYMPETGNYGPYIQSHRVSFYKIFAKDLVLKGRAFPCFCEKANSKEDIIRRREQELGDNDAICEKDPCRNFTLAQVKEKLFEKKSFALRLRSMGNGSREKEIFDIFKGKRTIKENAKDIVILKSDGIPPYALAHLTDDILMRTTKVIRGDDWYSSFPSHIELFEAAGFTPMQYGHNPLICTLDTISGNKRKLSKRHDPQADMRYYGQVGYPKESVLEYLLTIANSDFEIWRSRNPQESIYNFPFSLDKIGSNNPVFDWNKFNDISKNIIARMTCEQINKEVTEYYKGQDTAEARIVLDNIQKVYEILAIDRGSEKPRKDIIKYSDVYALYNYIFRESTTAVKDCLKNFTEGKDEKHLYEILAEYINIYSNDDSKDEWFSKIKALCIRFGYCDNLKDYKKNPDAFKGHIGDVTQIIRMAATGKENTPDLYYILKIIGKNTLRERFLLS